MSPQSTIILILAVLVFTNISVFWVLKVANERREIIVTGVYQGVPISMKHRRLMLSNDWAAFKFFPVGLLLILGFAFLRVGQSADDPDVQLVSFLGAGVTAPGAFFVAILGVSDLLFMLSVLRQSKRG